MSKELRDRYPKIFAENCEISTGPGWDNILVSACATIQSYIDNTHRQQQTVREFNDMADALCAGNDEPFFKYHHHWDPVKDSEFLDRRRSEILGGERRPVKEPCSQLVATQIKEKFGTLRFYHNGGDDICHGVVRMAEVMSGCTCQDCGAPGHLGGQHWISTLCNPCRARRESE